MAGKILSQVDFPILYKDDAQSLYDKVTLIALEQIEDFIPKLKGNDYKFIDRIIGEHIYAGGTGVYIHKYIGVYDQGEKVNDDGTIEKRFSPNALWRENVPKRNMVRVLIPI